MLLRRIALGVALASSLAEPARADHRLSPDDLARKNERGYVTGLPLVAYGTDIGLGLGARAYYYWNGVRASPLFAVTPYLHRVFAQAFFTTGGLQFHWLDYDAPNLGGSDYRLRASLTFERNTDRNYFGIGNAALAPFRFPGSPQTYESYTAYTEALRQIASGVTFAKYDRYDFVRPVGMATVERSLLGDRIRVQVGLAISYTTIDDYTGEQVDAVDAEGRDVTATSAMTRLRQDCDAGLLVGCNGGWDNALRLGFAYDTRDFEPDPNRGVFADVALDAATVALGSDFDYLRVLAAARGYLSPFRSIDLVFAARAMVKWQSEGSPFFSMNTLPFTDDTKEGLGGHRTMRGYRLDRFVGPVEALTNVEARWTFARTEILRQKLGFIVAPFFDLGRPFDDLGDLELADWRASYGGALRISWNLATIITVDYGRSSEDAGVYINFAHNF